MKKKLLLLTFAVIGIITAIAVTQLNNIGYDEILNANIEALAWNDSGGGDEIRCMPNGEICTYCIMLCDSNGKPIKDSEGNIILVRKEIPGLKNLPTEAQ